MSTQQNDRYEQRKQAERRRAQLQEQIARGEDSLLATDDNRTRRALNQKLTDLRNELERLDADLTRTVHESFHDFKARMKCDCIRLSQSERFHDDRMPDYYLPIRAGYYVFANGAVSDGMISHHEPSRDLITLLLTQRIYFEVSRNREARAFIQRKGEFDEMDHNHARWPMMCPGAPGWANDELRKRQEVITALKKQLAIIDQEIDTQPEVRAHLAQRQRVQQSAQDHRHDILQRQAERARITI